MLISIQLFLGDPQRFHYLFYDFLILCCIVIFLTLKIFDTMFVFIFQILKINIHEILLTVHRAIHLNDNKNQCH